MAEVIGIVGSVVGILAGAELAYQKLQSISGLPEAFSEVALRVPLAQQILRDVEVRSREASEDDAKAVLPIVKCCKGNAETLKTTLEKLSPGDSTSAWNLHVDKYISLIKSRGKKGRVEDLMKKILEDIYTLASHRSINAASSEQIRSLKEVIEKIGEVKNSVADELLEDGARISISHGGQGPMLNQVGDHNTTWNNFGSGHINNIRGDAHFGPTPDQRRREALRHLNCTSYEDHKNRNPEAMTNTCKWFTEHPTYQSWKVSLGESFLWVSADPGCGKSVLARYLIDHGMKASRVIYFFFKDGLDDQDNAESALKCLLHQLLKDNTHLFTAEIIKLIEELGEKRSKSFNSLWNIFTKVSHDVVDTICILDALDECKAVGWSILAKALGNLHKSGKTGMRFIFFSRPYSQVRRTIRNGRIPHINLRGEGEAEIGKISAEINIVIRQKVEGLVLESKLSLDEQEKVIQRLMQVGNRTYLWIHVICDMLEDLERVESDSLDKFFDRLPETVEDAYDKILLQSVDTEQAKTLLQIIVAAARPLSVEEMMIAMAVNSLRAFGEELSVMSADKFVGSMRNICGLFVVVVQEHVYLIHQTAREFLIRGTPYRRCLIWEASLNLEVSNQIIMKICVWYLLNIDERDPLSEAPTIGVIADYSEIYAFFDYASRYWVSHYLQSKMEENPNFIGDIVKLCDTHSTAFVAWYTYFLHITNQGSSVEWPNAYSGSLELASYLGIDYVVKEILAEGKYRLHGKHASTCQSALRWAATSGFHSIVMMLLETMDKQTTFMGHERLNIGLPLMAASKNGHKSIVETLLRTDRAKVNRDDAVSALLNAAEKGYDSIVELLLSNETDSDSRSLKTRWKAWFQKRKSTHDSDPYRSLLAYAVDRGHSTTLQTLLKSGKMDPNLKDRNGRTPLSHAAECGHANVVHTLLETGGVDVNSRDDFGNTPLLKAAEGNLSIVEMLLATRKVDIHAQNNAGKTPLAMAMEGGNPRIVHLLLTASSIHEDRLQQKLISFATAADDLSILMFLQKEWNAELKVTDSDIVERSPIIVALKHGSKKVFKYLLDIGQLHVDFEYKWKSRHGNIQHSTPLLHAAEKGHPGIMRILLSRKANVNFRSVVDGATALSLAVTNAQLNIVNLLLQVKGLDLSLRCQNGLTIRQIARKFRDCNRERKKYDDLFREIIFRLNWRAFSMPDHGEALRSLERKIIRNG